ncbi:glycine betaine ABC transporter substrate-binding protein [Marinilabiliaceae bacterium ANBcel2]|nr:glycine betaine ABC transporter substrate-binding protein [Marinilabiliaceae bacterium ANBcel2]
MIKTIFVTVISALLLVSCALSTSSDDNKQKEKQEITIIYTNWAESVAMSHLAAKLLEDRLGYNVILKLAEIDQVFEEIAKGKADVFPDVWKPATHEEYLTHYSGKFEDLGENYINAKTGLAVPDYSELTTIEDLRDRDIVIAGIDSSAGIMRYTNDAIEIYALNNKLIVQSDEEMSQMVEDAIRRRNEIVFTGWEPHWLFHRYDLKYLEDSQSVFMEEEQLHTIARIGFSEEYKTATEFFNRFFFSEREINELLYNIKQSGDVIEGVDKWIKDNPFTVNQWTKNLGREREKIM